MKYLLTLLIILFISGCSVQIVDMSPEPTVQKFDLTDSDSDGVILARDQCPETYLGSLVGNLGCGKQTLEKLRHNLLVNFDSNSYQVKSRYLSEIATLAGFMKKYPSTQVTIEGHTSIRGSRELNKTLSQNRAQAIMDILIAKFDIDESRITAIGYGFEKLLEEGDDESVHARNRRIVAEMSSDKSMKEMKWTIYSVDDLLSNDE